MLATLSRGLPGARWGVIAAPYLWLLVFFAIPFLIVLKISFGGRATAMPPDKQLLAGGIEGAAMAAHPSGSYRDVL
ncbi:putrescine ABC transporter permease PotH, partial [Xanthomonas perforans]